MGFKEFLEVGSYVVLTVLLVIAWTYLISARGF